MFDLHDGGREDCAQIKAWFVRTGRERNVRGVLWHRRADSGSLEAEPFVTLKKPIPPKVGCERKHLPEATLACAYSGLGHESSEQAYAVIRRWMNVRGYRLAGPKREIYLGQTLEIQFPLIEN